MLNLLWDFFMKMVGASRKIIPRHFGGFEKPQTKEVRKLKIISAFFMKLDKESLEIIQKH